MTTPSPSSLPVGRDADAAWIDQQVASRLFGAMPRRIGRYTILETLGSGGMGLVYRAHDAQLERMIAVKLLNADHSTEDGARRMQREAQAMARLSHANVVQVYEVGHHHEQIFLAMEYVEGETLERWLRRPHSPAAIHAMFLAIGEGIAAAHGVGITHRDLKPANILVDGTGRPKVADFGLARTEALLDLEHPSTLRGSQSGNPRITDVGGIVGTPRYMAPEQHTGQHATARSDQFSFCMMLWEALCGDLPFPEPSAVGTPGSTHWVLRPPARRGRLPARIRKTLARGLQVEPGLRWPTMTALLSELGRQPWIRRHAIPVFLMVALAALQAYGWARPTKPEEDPCVPAANMLVDHAQKQMAEWRTELARGEHSPEVRRYLGAMLNDWSEEVRELCISAASVDAAVREQTGALLRRGACIAQGAALLNLWLSEGQVARQIPALVKGYAHYTMEPPMRWDIEALDRTCLLTEAESYDYFRGAGRSDHGLAAQGMLRARILLRLHRPEEALAQLAILPRYLPAEPPAQYYQLRARAQLAADRNADVVLRSLYAAEDAAELHADKFALFDARIEQVRVVVAEHYRTRQRNQLVPWPAPEEAWDRKLETAATLLRGRGVDDGDEVLRLLVVRASLADLRGRYDEAQDLREELLEIADRSGSPRLRSQIYSQHAGLLADLEQLEEAAVYDARALESAPDDPELRGYLNYWAGSRALRRGDFEPGIRSMQMASEDYRSAFGPEAPQLADVDYTIAQALYMAGESAAALARADASVRENRKFGDRLQTSIALYLRSAIHARLGAAQLAVQDAEAAIQALPSPQSGPDIAMWQTIMKTARVEALVASGDFDKAIEHAAAVSQELEADPRLNIGGQSDELRLATATAWLGKDRPRKAARALGRVDLPDFLEHDAFKRAEALLLVADLASVPAKQYEARRTEALVLLAALGNDGASRTAAAQWICPHSGGGNMAP